MTEEQKNTAKNVWVTLAPYVGAVILDIALCGLLVASGKELTVEAIIAITGCVGSLLFFYKKGGVNIIPGGTLLIVSSLFFGCGACQTERRIVDATGIGIAVTDTMVSDRGGDEYSRASRIAHGVHSLGRAAVKACELARDGAGWHLWVELALEKLGALVAIITGAGPSDIAEPPPVELRRVIAMLEHETSMP